MPNWYIISIGHCPCLLTIYWPKHSIDSLHAKAEYLASNNNRRSFKAMQIMTYFVPQPKASIILHHWSDVNFLLIYNVIILHIFSCYLQQKHAKQKNTFTWHIIKKPIIQNNHSRNFEVTKSSEWSLFTDEMKPDCNTFQMCWSEM